MVIYLPCCYGEYGDNGCDRDGGKPCLHSPGCKEETFNNMINAQNPNGDIFQGF
jgi:hypothetical protein